MVSIAAKGRYMPDNCSKETWKGVAQPFELAHWQQADIKRKSLAIIRAGYSRASREIMDRFHFSPHSLLAAHVLEIGPGPTGRTLSFENVGRLVGVEPLYPELEKLWWAQFRHFDSVVAVPIEELELAETFDYAISLNCLDHCYDLGVALRQIYAHLCCGGEAFLSFDCNKRLKYDPTHPVNVTHREAHHKIQKTGFEILNVETGRCYPWKSQWLDSWGGGRAWHWWLRKPI
jgi:SAM-dependent methyltransferase